MYPLLFLNSNYLLFCHYESISLWEALKVLFHRPLKIKNFDYHIYGVFWRLHQFHLNCDNKAILTNPLNEA